MRRAALSGPIRSIGSDSIIPASAVPQEIPAMNLDASHQDETIHRNKIAQCLPDLRESKREKQYRKKFEKAQAVCNARSEFLAGISHEIRTEINGIMGMTELALETPLNEERQKYLTCIKSCSDSLLALFNQVLDFSKIEAEKLVLDPVDFKMRDWLNTAMAPFFAFATAKGLELICNIHPNVPDRLVGDKHRLLQVITNLVGNAIKFTEKGKITVCVNEGVLTDNSASIHFVITDTGIGIAPQKQKLIFEAYSQADASTQRKYGGTGLGLAIASRLVKMMEGTLWVESELGSGSAFHFTVRLGMQHDGRNGMANVHLPESSKILRNMPQADNSFSKDPRAEQGVNLNRSLHILLVEDDAVNQLLVARTLEKYGHKVVVACDGMEALAAYSQEYFDLIIMDAQMPVMSGFDAAIAIREKEKQSGAHIPILALTAHSLKTDRDKGLECGMDDYVTKPVKMHELLRAIEGLAGETRILENTDLSPALGASNPKIDKDAILKRMAGDKALLLEIINMFLDDCPKLMAQIDNARKLGSAKLLERYAHRLRGSLDMLSSTAASQAALQLERSGRENDLSDVDHAILILQKEIAQLLPALAAMTAEN
jgi:two-component system, sensor histidine kinase and response regulator